MTAADDTKPAVPDLHTALEAAIATRLWLATTATPGPWVVGGQGRRELRHPNGELFCVGIDDGERARWVADTWDGPDAAHIAVHDPADAVRRYERDLKVLKRHVPFDQPNWSLARGSFTEPGCQHCELTSNDGDPLARDWPCDDIADLLDVYPEVTRP